VASTAACNALGQPTQRLRPSDTSTYPSRVHPAISQLAEKLRFDRNAVRPVEAAERGSTRRATAAYMPTDRSADNNTVPGRVAARRGDGSSPGANTFRADAASYARPNTIVLLVRARASPPPPQHPAVASPAADSVPSTPPATTMTATPTNVYLCVEEAETRLAAVLACDRKSRSGRSPESATPGRYELRVRQFGYPVYRPRRFMSRACSRVRRSIFGKGRTVPFGLVEAREASDVQICDSLGLVSRRGPESVYDFQIAYDPSSDSVAFCRYVNCTALCCIEYM